MNESERMVCEIMRTWNECEKVWSAHIEEKIKEVEKTISQTEKPPTKIFQFCRK
jgi:hypothetical protein